jgi:hypothetical protein
LALQIGDLLFRVGDLLPQPFVLFSKPLYLALQFFTAGKARRRSRPCPLPCPSPA